MLRRTLMAAAPSVLLGGALLAGVLLADPALAATAHYTAKLSALKEIPKNDSKGTGSFDATFDSQTKTLKYTLTFEDLSGAATAAHLHGPATSKQSAGVVAPLGDKALTSPVSGSLTLTDDQVKMLRGSKLYVNVHTAANPGGEIRGQVVHASHKTPASAQPAKQS